MGGKKRELQGRSRPKAKRSAKAGMPPGSLVLVGERKTSDIRIRLIEYGPEQLEEIEFPSIEASRDHALTAPVMWLNVHGLHDAAVMQEIGRRFNLHPLVLEDILNTDQRPKVDDYGDYLYLVTRFFDYDAETLSVRSEQVSLVLGKNFVLTFQERPTGNFEPIRDRLRKAQGQVRKMGADYLAYALLDVTVDRYFSVLEQIGERTEQLEDDLLQSPGPGTLQTLHQLKRESMVLRRAVWPLREMLNQLTRSEGGLFQPATLPYLRDIYDHTVHVIESLEAIRDLISGMLDIYLSSVSNRLNQEVRALTVVAIIFMPSTLITGIFGMNFRSMPLLENNLGFYVAIGLMGTIASSLGLVFWRRRWLG